MSGEAEIEDGETKVSVESSHQMVSNCEAQFGRVTEKVCKRIVASKIISAAERVTDGIAVGVNDGDGSQHERRIRCDYE